MKEIELKYQLNNQKEGIAVLNSPFLLQFTDLPVHKIEMEAVYYDTKEHWLAKQKIAYRVRRENNEFMATVKWSEKGNQGLFERGEHNLKVGSINPDIQIFPDSIKDQVLMGLPEDAELSPVLTTIFVRSALVIQYMKSKMEIAFDYGKIIAEEKSLPICELEVELLKGDRAELLAFGRILQEEFHLSISTKSKFSRGMELLNAKKG